MPPSEMDRLEAAMQVFLTWQLAGGGPPDELLARHPGLRDLLEPLLREQAPEPTLLGDFELLGELGRGGMGIVYEARQISLQRRVALKVLPAHLTLRPASIARFQREATIAARLQHPGIVKIHAVGSSDGAHYFAMDLVQGVPLSAELIPREDPRRIATLVGYVLQVAEALAYAHAQGVIHRDVKPSNILVTADGRALLTDFGLAREEELPNLSLTGEFSGTPHYASPEQAQGRRTPIDQRTDLFSLGATLYEVVTGRRAFDGATTQEILGRILTRDPVDPQRVDPLLAGDLAAITMKALEKEPARRYQTAQELADDLRAFLEYRPVRARPVPPLARLLRAMRREPWKAALAVVLLLAVPGLTGLSGYILAKESALRVGETTLQQRDVERLVGEGFLAWRWKDSARAAPAFAQALALDPHGLEARCGAVMVALQRGDGAQARQWIAEPGFLERASGLRWIEAAVLRRSGDEAAAEAAASSAGEPQEPIDFFLAGVRELDLHGTSDQAAAARALAHFTSACLRSPAPRLVHHGMRALAAARAEDLAALHESVAVLERQFGDLDASWWFIGMALAHSEPVRAEQALDRAIAIHPDQALGEVNRAVMRFNAKDYDGALASAARALALDPDRGAAHLITGLTRLTLGENDQAIPSLRRAAELLPRELRAHYALGNALLARGDHAAAARAFRAALAIDPAHGDARANLGAVLLELEDQAAAEQVLREGMKLSPRHAGVHNNLLVIFDERADTAAVLAEQQRWVELHPEDPNAWHELAHAEFDEGLRDAAIASAERSLTLLRGTDRASAALRAEIEQCLQEFRGR